MTKLHLKARAPNEGARRLARWVMRVHRGDLSAAGKAIRVSVDKLERIVAGEILPGEVLCIPLGIHCDIGGRLWRRPAAGGWFDADCAGEARAA